VGGPEDPSRRLRLRRQFDRSNGSWFDLQSLRLDYSLWYYSVNRSSISLPMQERRGRSAALKTPEDCFGEVLRELRQKKGVTQEDLAFKSGYHSTYISQLERGRKSPSLRAIMSLAGALNTSGSEILTRLEALLD
jgi:DNA-binding XRE family transcriptional regulator